jgi:hypothetical protein
VEEDLYVLHPNVKNLYVFADAAFKSFNVHIHHTQIYHLMLRNYALLQTSISIHNHISHTIVELLGAQIQYVF